MVRFAVALLAILLVCLIVWVVVPSLPIGRLRKPDLNSSNAQWANYYHQLAEQAERDGNEGKAYEYGSLARMYELLDDQSRDNP
jgi:hypothetical protein